MKTETTHFPCVKVEKRSGEDIRRVLKERNLLRTDARITSDDKFVYLPLIRTLNDTELREIGAAELLTRDFVVREERKSIEAIVGFKPSYEIIGDIAVLTEAVNETKEQLVAHVLMERHKNIKVVAKRVSPVEGIFRTRKIQIIAGENRTETIHREHGCSYKIDLEKVYFNPRLAGERHRVASQLDRSTEEEIIDMFAGVGSFSIQLAKRAPQSHVIAIDINPDAIRYLEENIRLNRISNIEAVEGDVKEIFVRFGNKADRIIMNLPKSASEFLREALGMLKPQGGIIHFYTVESDTSHEALLDKAKEKFRAHVQELSDELQFDSVAIWDARKVKAYAPYTYIIGIDAKVKKITQPHLQMNCGHF
jgi:tRNA (guanine37-N1)-methyltransferase